MFPSSFVSPLLPGSFPTPTSKHVHASPGICFLNQTNYVVLKRVLWRLKCFKLFWLPTGIELYKHVVVVCGHVLLVLPNLEHYILAVVRYHGLLDELALWQAHHINAILNFLFHILVIFLRLIRTLGILHAPYQTIGSECDTSSIFELDQDYIITDKSHCLDLI